MDIIVAMKKQAEAYDKYFKETTRILEEALAGIQTLDFNHFDDLVSLMCAVEKKMEEICVKKQETDKEYIAAKNAYENASRLCRNMMQ